MDNCSNTNRMWLNMQNLLQAPLRIILPILLVGSFLMAQDPPPAGSVIGNQATATYTDESGTSRTVTSNLVQTIVNQIPGLDLVPDLSRTASPSAQIVFPHTITNTGNGVDTYTLSTVQLGSSEFTFTSIELYADVNGDGQADNNTPLIVTPPLAPGEVYNFVIVAQIPPTASEGNRNQMLVLATSDFDDTISDSVTDITTITGNAVINLVKSMSAGEGDPGSGPHQITLSYTNAGNVTASSVVITDALPNGMSYLANSARWSESGAIVLSDGDNTDLQGTAPNTIIYDFGITAVGQVTATISEVLPGQSATLTFDVVIDGDVPHSTLNNTANYSYNDGSGEVGPFESNTVPFQVNLIAEIIAVGDTIRSSEQGGVIYFENIITNSGNARDIFNVTLGINSFPAGTSFFLLKSDGRTPLLDTNGDGIPDTGPLNIGETDTVVVQVLLPPNVDGGPSELEKTATSTNDPSVSVTVTDVLAEIAPNTVDLTNNSSEAGAPGSGPGPEATPVTINEADPGTTTRFSLYVNNTSALDDNYSLTASTDSTFATLSLPEGWTVIFRNQAGLVVTNTGNISSGENVLIYADVTVPAGERALPAPGQSLFFRIESPATGAGDVKHDAVVVNTVRRMDMVPNNTGQVFPGGTVVYPHTIINNGNVTENDLGNSTLSLAFTNTESGWNIIIYLDGNENGVLDLTDQPILTAADLGVFEPGDQRTILIKVTAPGDVELGISTITTTTLLISGIINGIVAPPSPQVVDVTTVILGNVTLDKSQAIDFDCDGNADISFTSTNLDAEPGQCIMYRIVITNLGSNDITDVMLSDATPAYTTYFESGSGTSTTRGSIVSVPLHGSTGSIVVNIGTLAPGQSATLSFSVKIDE